MNTAPIVSRVWSFCTTLRDDGVSYGDYLEQLTYLIFLKMADEYGKPPYSRDVGIPAAYDWQSLKTKRGAELEAHYVTLLRELGTRRGMLGQIFTKAQNKIQDPAKLYRLIDMVDDTDWVTLGADVKGDIYEGLLEKNAEDTKSGAGQYFTPRALIRAMVECVRPEPGKRIADPACGTGGFFLGCYDFITDDANFTLDREQKEFLKHKTFHGNEIVANTRRLCLMNLFLHNIGEIDGSAPISPNDSLVADGGERYDCVLANPPFVRKSALSFTNEEGEQETDDLTYNRQGLLGDHLQQATQLRAAHPHHAQDDRARRRRGAGQRAVRGRRRRDDPPEAARHHRPAHHTALADRRVLRAGRQGQRDLLRQPRSQPDPWTKRVWYYDYRTNIHHTLKKKPMRFEDLADFIKCYNPHNRHERTATWDENSAPEGRWRSYGYGEIIARDKTGLDIFWLKDKSLTDLDDLPEPEDLAAEIIESLEAGLESFRKVLEGLG